MFAKADSIFGAHYNRSYRTTAHVSGDDQFDSGTLHNEHRATLQLCRITDTILPFACIGMRKDFCSYMYIIFYVCIQ